MRYQDLENSVYDALQRGRTDEALKLVYSHTAEFSGADLLDLQHLLINVQALVGVRNLRPCIDTIRIITENPVVKAETRIKSHLLGAHIATQLQDDAEWEFHLQRLAEVADESSPWFGRRRLLDGLYQSEHGWLENALQIHTANCEWWTNHIGPYGERDRLHQLAFVHIEASRLLLTLGRVSEAKSNHEAADSIMPIGINRAHITLNLARCLLADSRSQEALTEARSARDATISQPIPYLRGQADEVVVECLVANGEISEARSIVVALESLALDEKSGSLLLTAQRLEAALARREVGESG